MHTADRTSIASLFASTAFGVVRSVAAGVTATWRAWRNRKQVVELLEFDDRMLADIGLMRGDVTSALASPLDVDPSTRLRVFAVERRAGMRAAARERIVGFADIEAAARGIPAE